MKSMTGYGSSQHKDRQIELEVHVKSVNGRFLEVRCHLPKEYAPFETELRRNFKTWTRGTVDVYIHRRLPGDSKKPSVNIHAEHAQYWARELRALAKSLKLEDTLTIRDILQMPQVIETEVRTGLLPDEIKMVEKQLTRAIAACDKLRIAEGRSLRVELLKQLKTLDQLADAIEKWRPEALKTIEQRLKARLSAMSADGMDPARLAVETALLTDKMDVHEEVVRLREHVRACRALVQSKDARGKKLDFYCQELLREVNTIGSKSQLASLTQTVVEAKSVVEKFREQVQNIE